MTQPTIHRAISLSEERELRPLARQLARLLIGLEESAEEVTVSAKANRRRSRGRGEGSGRTE